MNRRDFLKALGALGVTAALAESIVVASETHAAPIAGPIIESDDLLFIDQVNASAVEGVSRPVALGLMRPNTGLVINLVFNSFGGHVCWFDPREPIAVIKGYPVAIEAYFDGVVSITVRNGSRFEALIYECDRVNGAKLRHVHPLVLACAATDDPPGADPETGELAAEPMAVEWLDRERD